MAFPFITDILEQVLTWEFLQRANDCGDPSVGNLQVPVLSGFSLEDQPQVVAIIF